jgi:hypothetical protein
MRAVLVEGEVAIRNPIRGIFVGCFALATTATPSSITTTRNDRTAAFFIAQFASSVMYHADRDKEKCYLRQKENRIRRGEKAKIGLRLN